MEIEKEVTKTAEALNSVVSAARQTEGELIPPLVPAKTYQLRMEQDFPPVLADFIDTCIAGLEDPGVVKLAKRFAGDNFLYNPYNPREFDTEFFVQSHILFVSGGLGGDPIKSVNPNVYIFIPTADIECSHMQFHIYYQSIPSVDEFRLTDILDSHPTPKGKPDWDITRQDSKANPGNSSLIHANRRFYGSDAANNLKLCERFLKGVNNMSANVQGGVERLSQDIKNKNKQTDEMITAIKRATEMVQKVIKN